MDSVVFSWLHARFDQVRPLAGSLVMGCIGPGRSAGVHPLSRALSMWSIARAMVAGCLAGFGGLLAYGGVLRASRHRIKIDCLGVKRENQ